MNHLPKILKAAEQHADWCSKEIAMHLGVSWSHVRQTGVQKGLKFADGNARAKVVPGLRKAKVLR